MSDMLHTFVKKELEKQIQENYPHMRNPSGMYAKVTQVREESGKYVCTLKILDKIMNVDNDVPEIPNVRTDIPLHQGDIAVILFLYGGSGVFVLGRYES